MRQHLKALQCLYTMPVLIQAWQQLLCTDDNHDVAVLARVLTQLHSQHVVSNVPAAALLADALLSNR